MRRISKNLHAREAIARGKQLLWRVSASKKTITDKANNRVHWRDNILKCSMYMYNIWCPLLSCYINKSFVTAVQKLFLIKTINNPTSNFFPIFLATLPSRIVVPYNSSFPELCLPINQLFPPHKLPSNGVTPDRQVTPDTCYLIFENVYRTFHGNPWQRMLLACHS